MDNNLKICHWNARSLKANLAEFNKFLSTHSPHIVCICETWLTYNFNPKFLNYTLYRQDRLLGKGGGMLILVRKEISHNILDLTPYQECHMEIQALQIFLDDSTYSILSCYNPCVNVNIVLELDHYISQLTHKIIVCGDFNLRHQAWDSRVQANSFYAKAFYDYILASPLILLTPKDLSTRFDINSSKYSTLDLTLISASELDQTHVKAMQSIGSDHLPMLITVTLKSTIVPLKKRPKWRIPKDNEKWSSWEQDLAQVTLPKLTLTPISDCLHSFTQTVLDVSEKHFGKTKATVSPFRHRPWWTAACSKQVALRKRARRFCERHPTQMNKILYKKQFANARRTIRTAKRAAWRKFTSNLTFKTPSAEVWSMIRNINGRNYTPNVPLKFNGQTAITDIEKSQLVALSLGQKIGSTTALALPPVDCPRRFPDPSTWNYNSPFTKREFTSTIANYSSGKGTATGDDLFHKHFFKHLPNNYVEYLYMLLNAFWSTAEVPTLWKISVIIPITKPGKNVTDVDNLRPISLLSCLGKLMEKLIYERLYWMAEHFQILNPSQSGFRKLHSSTDQILRLESYIRLHLRKRHHVLVVFFDLKSAFDSINYLALLHKLRSIGLQGNLLHWLESYFQNRTFKVLVGNSFSDVCQQKQGTPQGSILSPLLFSLYGIDMPQTVSTDCSEFADDVAFYTFGETIDEAERRLQEQVDCFEDWCSIWGLEINVEKTKIMHFTTKQKLYKTRKPVLTLHDVPLELVHNYKFLGMVLDGPLLTWKEHISYLVQACQKRLNIMKVIASKNWGADQKTLLMFYNAYILGKLNYGAPIYDSASISVKEKLNPVQNAALRLATRVRRTTPVVVLQGETNSMPLQYNRDIQTIKYYYKLRSMPIAHYTRTFLLQAQSETSLAEWSPIFRPTFFHRVSILLNKYTLHYFLPPSWSIAPFPPWSAPNNVTISTTPPEGIDPHQPSMNNSILLEHLSKHFPNYQYIYTDGSKINNPSPSTSSAAFVQQTKQIFAWKIDPSHCILTAEIFALLQALHIVLRSKLNAVILTDSQTSLHMLNGNPAKHLSWKYLIDLLQLCLTSSEHSVHIHFQWIPGHAGIRGNTSADLAAKAAHSLPLQHPTQLQFQELTTQVDIVVRSYSDTLWKRRTRGSFYGQLKTSLFEQSCPPSHHIKLEKCLNRLRSGHAGLNRYLHWIKILDSPYCTYCPQIPESIDHYLLSCPKYYHARQQLKQSLINVDIHDFNIVTLLGGAPYSPKKQSLIKKLLFKYLIKTGRLSDI